MAARTAASYHWQETVKGHAITIVYKSEVPQIIRSDNTTKPHVWWYLSSSAGQCEPVLEDLKGRTLARDSG